MRLTVQDFCQHSTNTLSVMKAKYKKEPAQTLEAFFSTVSVGEKRIFSTSTVSSIFKSKEVVDISVINVVANFLSQVIFVFLLFLGMVMYANEI